MKKLSEIFDIWYGVNLELINCESAEKGIPFVSRQAAGNGIAGYVMPIDIAPNPAHTLSIAGSGNVLSTFYHDYEYYSGRDVYIAKPKRTLTQEQMLFYAYVIEANKYRYNYGRQANKTLRNILVPDIDELPDYVSEYRLDMIVNKFDAKPLCEKKIKLNVDRWRYFCISKLFDVYASKEENAMNRTIGNVPFISSSQFSNGVGMYVDDVPTIPKDTITVARNGSVGSAFYQPIPYCASPDDIRVLRPKFKINEYIALFLVTVIETEKFRYGYGRKYGTKKIKTTGIKLPVTKDGAPDWQFMEDYIKSLPYSKLI